MPAGTTRRAGERPDLARFLCRGGPMIRFEWGPTRQKKTRYLVTPDVDGDLRDRINRFTPEQRLALFGRNQWVASERNGSRYDNRQAVGLPIVNWPERPPIELNTVYWPVTGATRWAHALVLVRGSDVLVHQPTGDVKVDRAAEKEQRAGDPF